MGEIRRTLMEMATWNPFFAPVFTRNFIWGMRLDAPCLALALRLHPST